MRSKVIFGHPKWPKSDFQNPGGHFEKKTNYEKKLRIDLKWREMHSKVIFGPPAAILRKKIKIKIKVAY